MNTAFLLAGTVNTNPSHIIIELVLIFAAAGLVWGLDGIVARRWGWRLPGLISGQSRRLPSWLSLSIAAILAILGIAAFRAAHVMVLSEFNNCQPAQPRAPVRRRILRGQGVERYSPRAEADVG